MATQAQIQANRLNAEKSTGPRTEEGKRKASQNALKHGLLAQTMVIAGEDLGEFEFYRDELLGELAPAGAVETVLAQRVVNLSWRLRRAERAQNEVFDALLAKDADFPVARRKESLPMEDGSEVFVEETPLGRAVVRDFTYTRVLDRLSMYERRIEYSLYKSMSELRRLRLMREAEPATEKPPRPEGRCRKPEPAPATQPAGAGCAASGGAVRQTKPIGWAGHAENAVRPETRDDRRQESRSGGPVSREAGRDCVKRSQCAIG